jgi:ABC-type hemin transport system ATPase subunit
VDDAGGVRLGEPLGGLRDVGQQRPQARRLLVDLVLERDAVDELHRDEVDRLTGRSAGRAERRVADLVDRDNVRMVQRGGRAGLLDEPAHALVVAHQLGRQDLQRDRAPEHRIVRPVHLTHPACAQATRDLIVRNDRSRFYTHRHSSISC